MPLGRQARCSFASSPQQAKPLPWGMVWSWNSCVWADLDPPGPTWTHLGSDPGEPGTGVPYSVFFPVDNLARYWYGAFLKRPERVKYLGPIMHALQI